MGKSRLMILPIRIVKVQVIIYVKNVLLLIIKKTILVVEHHTNYTKDPSLSPLSKKMAIHSAAIESYQKQQSQFNQPYFIGQQTMTNKTVTETTNIPVLPNEFKVCFHYSDFNAVNLLKVFYLLAVG